MSFQRNSQKKTYSIGIDYHKTFTNDPEYFNKQFCMLKDKYNEKIKIIIISGAYENEQIEEKITKTLNKFQYKWWNSVFLIPSFLKDKTEPLFYEDGNPIFDDYDWYRVKAKYCSENNIDFHIDNNSEYLMFFNTSFILYNGSKNFKIENKSIYDFFDEEIKKTI